jgi:hypothetical protein
MSDMTAEGIGQFLNLVDILSEQHARPDSEDEVTWHLTASGEYKANLLTQHSSMAPQNLLITVPYGNAGHPLNAEFLPGLLLLTDVGLLNFACDIIWLTRRGHLRSLRSGNGVDLTSVDTMLFFTADLARYPFKFKYTSLHAKFG